MGILEDSWLFTNPINYMGLLRPLLKMAGYEWIYDILGEPLKYIFPQKEGEEPTDADLFKWIGNISKVF